MKDDEYKPAKFNLLVKISGWFRQVAQYFKEGFSALLVCSESSGVGVTVRRSSVTVWGAFPEAVAAVLSVHETQADKASPKTDKLSYQMAALAGHFFSCIKSPDLWAMCNIISDTQ